ncbi:MAG: hypothetical protein ABIP94_10170, partial [Planctomycetota bacterium]
MVYVERRAVPVLSEDPTLGPSARFARAVAGDRQAREQLLLDNLPRLEAFLRLQAGAALRRKESLSDL